MGIIEDEPSGNIGKKYSIETAILDAELFSGKFREKLIGICAHAQHM